MDTGPGVFLLLPGDFDEEKEEEEDEEDLWDRLVVGRFVVDVDDDPVAVYG